MKALIVEDEPMEARALRALLLKYHSGAITEIIRADNGAAAVETARAERPDLIFMDIHLPEMDGVSASRAIRAFDDGVEIIMLTAFADFEYARQSIANGVADYVVKPYSVKTLREAVFRAVDRIAESRRERDELESSRNLVGMLQREFLHKVLVNFRLREEIIRRYVQMIGIYEKRYRILLFQPGGDPASDSPAWEELFSRLRAGGIQYMHTQFTHTVCVIPFADRTAELASPVDRIVAEWRRNHPASTCRIGDAEKRWEDIAMRFYEMLTSLINPGGGDPEELPEIDLEERLGEAVVGRDRERALAVCRELVDVAYKKYATANDFGYTLIAAYRGLLRTIHALENRAIDEKTRDFTANFRVPYRGDREAAFADLSGSVEQIITWLDDSVRGKTSRVIHLVKKYIDARYAENITLEALARHVCISRFYLSRMFKNHENETIVGYIQRVRVENAKRILLAGGSASEACYRCGFSDPAYFGKIFKKAVGVSPASFAQRHTAK